MKLLHKKKMLENAYKHLQKRIKEVGRDAHDVNYALPRTFLNESMESQDEDEAYREE